MQIQNNTFLVTGGASGLGEATTRYLVAKGANVIVADLNQDAGDQLATELGDSILFAKCDVTSEADVKTAIDNGIAKFGKLSGAINCAGIVVVQKLIDKEGNPADLATFTRGINVNLIGSFNVARLAAAVMSKNNADNNIDKGVIINTASIAAFDGQIGQASYSASKAGVVGMMLPLARELARHQIRIMTIAPGVFGTPMMASLPEAARTNLEQSVPYPKRLGSPEEFAKLVAHIIENDYLNAEVIRLDGAIRMS
ncbi:3-hydroxyacyl-CoA dehydrogenase (plasmid) [Moraxella osloensis]|nr:3-hydroxyacyl-CoA dehydrogenase [Moraxella osloensis]MBL7668662.1 3-hydroxyacyl-CoA dehydrogenase [Moraxella osloensis]